MRRTIWIVALLSTIALLGACGGDEEPSDAAGSTENEQTSDDPATSGEGEGGDSGDLTVTARDFSFDPNGVTVPAGEEVTLTFANDGEVPHTFTSEALGVDERAAPGQTVEITFTADGDAEFHCEIHPGMIGSVTTG